MANLPILSFNAGLLSPQIDTRSDVKKYSSGCRILENMIPRIYGPAERRPGFKFIRSVIDSDVVSMLSPFIFSSTIAYQLEFGDLNLRFFFDGGIVLGPDDPVEVTTPYLEADLFQLQTKQSADVMWIVHGDYAPRKLSRISATAFTLDTITFNNGPFLRRNDLANADDVTMTIGGLAIATATAGAKNTGKFTITSSSDISSLFPPNKRFYIGGSTGNDAGYTVHDSITTYATTYVGTTLTVYANETIADGTDDGEIMVAGGTGTLTCSVDIILKSGHADALFKLTQKRVLPATRGTLTGTNTGIIGQAIDIKGSLTITTGGNWAGTIELQRNEDGTNWETVKPYTSTITNGIGSGNLQKTEIEEQDNVQYRMFVTAHTSGTISATLTANESTQDGIIRITSVDNPTTARITFVTPFPSTTATKRWAEGAWSGVQGYPVAFTFFEERAVYAKGQTIWLSGTGDFEDFEEGINDADSFSLAIPAADNIQWIESLEALVVGTTGGEWRIRSTTLDEPLAPPPKVSVKQQTSYGGRNIQAIKVNQAVLFIDFVGRKVREMTFSDERQKYVAPDLTALAEHITEGIIKDYAYQRNPDSILWFVLEDGTLKSMTYEREQNVVAWSEHPVGGGGIVESVSVIPGDTEDEVWVTVQRTINDNIVRYIEQMQPRDFGDQVDAFFVDSGLSYAGDPTDTFSGLGHLEGEEVSILGDGGVLASKTVADGKIAVDEAVSVVHVGLPSTYRLSPMRMDISTQTGTTMSRVKKISEISISLYKSLNVQYGDSTTAHDIEWRTTEPYGNPPELFTGITPKQTFDGGFKEEDPIIISGSDPLPCTVRAIIPRIQTTGR